jgi:hypothetical protein
MHSLFILWIHSNRQKKRRSTKEKTERQTPIQTEQACRDWTWFLHLKCQVMALYTDAYLQIHKLRSVYRPNDPPWQARNAYTLQHILRKTVLCLVHDNFPSYVKVTESCNRPGVAQRVPGGLSSKIFMTFGTWRWWGRQPHAPAAFIPRNVPGTHFH